MDRSCAASSSLSTGRLSALKDAALVRVGTVFKAPGSRA